MGCARRSSRDRERTWPRRGGGRPSQHRCAGLLRRLLAGRAAGESSVGISQRHSTGKAWLHTLRASLAASRSYRTSPSDPALESPISSAGGLSLLFVRPFSCATGPRVGEDGADMEERITSEGKKGKTREESENREGREYRVQDGWNDAQDQ